MADIDEPLDAGRVTHLYLMHRTEHDDGSAIPDGYLLAADGAKGHTWTDPAGLLAGGTGTLLDILGWYDAIVDGGCAADGVTDDTTAINNLLDTATASGTRSAVIYFPVGVYLIAGNVNMPAVSASDPQITIAFIGANRPPFQPLGSIPNPNGYSVLRGTATTGTATMNGGTSPTPNNIAVVVKNLLCIGNNNPSITFWNLEMTYPGAIEGLMISVTPWTSAPTYPTHAAVYGVTLPINGHSNGMTVDGLQIGGYYTCIKLGELERGRDWVFGNCVIAMESSGAYHSGFIESVHMTGYTYGLYSTGGRTLDIINFDTERVAGTFATTADIYDPGDDLYGYIRWYEITSGVGPQHLFTVTGGANLLTEEIGPTWGGGGSPSGAAGGDLSGTYPNPTVPHITDATDAHDASAISIADAGGYFTGTDVEAALQEIGASGGNQYRAWLFSASGGTLTILTATDGTPLTGLMDLE